MKRQLSRRHALGFAAAAAAAARYGSLGSTQRHTAAAADPPAIRPRADWAEDLTPIGPLEAEDLDDVRFLIVHHTASSNAYEADQVAAQLRSFYALHTSPEKGWPDIAYNFLVDRFGQIWEGREGSIESPIKGDATGGSQGHALLCCLIGNHQNEAPTSAAVAALGQLLGWLSYRYGIDTTPGATIEFVSRGSNRWAEGTTVTARTVSGHRDMSMTTCPGDLLYPLIAEELPLAATAASGSFMPTVSTTAATTTTSTLVAAPEATAVPASTTSTTISGATTTPAAGPDGLADAAPPSQYGRAAEGPDPVVVAAGVGVLMTVAGGIVALRRRLGAN